MTLPYRFRRPVQPLGQWLLRLHVAGTMAACEHRVTREMPTDDSGRTEHEAGTRTPGRRPSAADDRGAIHAPAGDAAWPAWLGGLPVLRHQRRLASRPSRPRRERTADQMDRGEEVRSRAGKKTEPPGDCPGEAIALLRIPAFGADYEIPILDGHRSGRSCPGRRALQLDGAARVRSATSPSPATGSPTASRSPSCSSSTRGDQIIVETRDAIYTYVMDDSPRELTVHGHRHLGDRPGARQAGREADRGADHPDHLPGPVPLPGPLGRLRPPGRAPRTRADRGRPIVADEAAAMSDRPIDDRPRS